MLYVVVDNPSHQVALQMAIHLKPEKASPVSSTCEIFIAVIERLQYLTDLLWLLTAGHDCYLVGGAVRDQLLGHTPKDFDVLTSATPKQVLW